MYTNLYYTDDRLYNTGWGGTTPSKETPPCGGVSRKCFNA